MVKLLGTTLIDFMENSHTLRARAAAIVARVRPINRAGQLGMSSLPEMYAMFPMIAVQRYLGESSAGTRLDDQRQLGIFLEVGRYFFIYGVGARFAEAVAILFSPVHWLTLEWARRRVDAVTPCTAPDGGA